jgi:hypothetical protein
MPMDKTENILKKMIAQGYIIRVVERNADDESIDWIVGPRGHAEIGKKGIQRFVEEIYGESAPEDLSQRLERSLGIEKRPSGAREVEPEEEAEEEEEADSDVPGPSTQRISGRQRRVDDD